MSKEKTKTQGVFSKDTVYLERLGGVRDLLRAAKKQLRLSLYQRVNTDQKQTDVASYVYQIDDHSFFTDEIKTHFIFPEPQQGFINGQAPLSNPANGSSAYHRSFITTFGDQKYLSSKVISTTLRLTELIAKIKKDGILKAICTAGIALAISQYLCIYYLKMALLLRQPMANLIKSG